MGYTANKTAGEMYEAFISGVTVMLHCGGGINDSEFYVPVMEVDRGFLTSNDYMFRAFSALSDNGISLYSDSSSGYPTSNIALIPNPGAGGESGGIK